MRGLMFAGAALLLAVGVAACEREQDPLADARDACESADVDARVRGCTVLIESGELETPARASALSNRGTALLEKGEPAAALRDFNAALDLDDDNMAAVLGRASILIDSGQLDAAQPLVDRLIADGAFPGEAQYLDGLIALQRGDTGAAIEAFDRAVAAEPRHARALAQRGWARRQQQELPAALSDFDAALRIEPRLAPALAGRCWTLLAVEDGDVAAARRDADAAVEADPRDIRAQLCRGLLQLRSGEWAAAKDSYEAALALQPGNPEALFGRGVARRRGGDAEGRQDMNQARDFSPYVARQFEDRGVETY